MRKKEEDFSNVAQIGEIETEEMPSLKCEQSKGKTRKWKDEEKDLLINLL